MCETLTPRQVAESWAGLATGTGALAVREASAWLPWAPAHRTNEHISINLFLACSLSPWTSVHHPPLSILLLLLFQKEHKD